MKRLITIFVVLLTILSACKERIVVKEKLEELPKIFPDYIGVTIPSIIAPLNFKVDEIYTNIAVEFMVKDGDVLDVRGKKSIKIPEKKWKKILSESSGDSLKVTVSIKKEKGWVQFASFHIYVSTYPIDYNLVYRRIAPGYEVFSCMGIYQRELSSFNESPIIENTLFPGSCMNCHSYSQNDPTTMMFHLRGPLSGTLIYKDNKVIKLNSKTKQTIGNFQYSYWHPSKNYIAYSVNKTSQTFHSTNKNRLEVFDSSSDVLVYDIRRNTILTTEALFAEDCYETWPTFSPEGDYLYYATAPAMQMPQNYDQLKYSLCRISFNPETGQYGNKADTLINAAITGKSVSLPRISPDGRYLIVTSSNYGNFPIWHKDSELFLLDLHSGTGRLMNEVNSDDVDSYHSWSSNGRWIVFSSRRVNGLYTMPFIAYFDEKGKFGKPFLLPQEDPDYYENTFFSFNIPELVNGPVNLNISALEHEVYGNGKNVTFMQIDKK